MGFGDAAKFMHLHSGDFWIMYNGKLLFLFERKTLRDLSASLTGDERWSSQKFKMEQMPIHPSRTFYLIEDSMSLSNLEKEGGEWMAKRGTIAGGEINAIVRDRRRIFRTIDMNETIYLLLTFVRKAYEYGHTYEEELKSYCTLDNKFDPLKIIIPSLEEERKKLKAEKAAKDVKSSDSKTAKVESKKRKVSDDDDDDSEGSGSGSDDCEAEGDVLTEVEKRFVETRKKGKCADNPDTFYLTCLTRIPRMGKSAQAIMNRFPKLTILIDFFRDEDMSKKEKLKVIQELPKATSNMSKKKITPTKTATGKVVKPRKAPTIGKVMAAKLYEYIINEGT